MLTEDRIYQNKVRYLELLAKLGIDLTKLTKYLDSIDYFNKPASTQYFRAYPGGLCSYALDLFNELAQLANAYFPGRYTEADIIKVALFKDIYKAELYEPYNKNVKDDITGKWYSQLAYRYKEVRPTYGDLGFNAYMITRHFIDLTDEQIEAITQVNSEKTYNGDIHAICRTYPLVTLTKMADLAAGYLEDEQ